MIKKVVITGATSFIGIALINKLLEMQYDVVAIIRPNSSRKKVLQRCLGLTLLETELCDIMDSQVIQKCKGCDWVMHLGWSSDFSNPRYNYSRQKMNVEYTLKVIEMSYLCGAKVFVGIGSQAECGVVNIKITEYTPDNPLTAYAEAKCETYQKSIEKCSDLGIRFCWPRLLSAYGPYDRTHTMVMSSILAGIQQNNIDYTKCEQIWDYIYVEDVADALLAIAESGRHGIKYPIASGVGLSLEYYIRIISMELGNSNLLEGIGKKEYVSGQPMYLVGDISGLNKDTGFWPKYTFEDGIRKTIDYIKKEIV